MNDNEHVGWGFQTDDNNKKKSENNENIFGLFGGQMDFNFNAKSFPSFNDKNDNENDDANDNNNDTPERPDRNDKNEPEEEPVITFTPIIELNEKTVATGHENETLLESIPFKVLYRWGEDVSGKKLWKARATNTTITFYKNKENNKVRMVVREELTSKLRLNHYIPHNENVATRDGDLVASWKAYDCTIAEEEKDQSKGLTMWSIKFKEKSDCQKFQKLFSSNQSNIQQ